MIKFETKSQNKERERVKMRDLFEICPNTVFLTFLVLLEI